VIFTHWYWDKENLALFVPECISSVLILLFYVVITVKVKIYDGDQDLVWRTWSSERGFKIIEKDKGKIKMNIFDWLRNEFIKSFYI